MIAQPADAVAFLTKECEHLRQTYYESIKEIQTLERYCLVTVGAIWSWCAANLSQPSSQIVIWIPVLIAPLFGLRAWGIYRTLAAMRRYLHRVEAAFQLPDALGWERYHGEHPDPVQVASGYAFWIALQALTGVAALVFHRLVAAI